MTKMKNICYLLLVALLLAGCSGGSSEPVRAIYHWKTTYNPTDYELFDVNRLYAIVNNTDTVLIQYYTFDNILQPASYFLGHDTAIDTK